VSDTATDVVTRYLQVWNDRRVDLIKNLCADPVIRHEPGAVKELSHRQQAERIEKATEGHNQQFNPVVIAGDEDYVTLVWDMSADQVDVHWSGIEVFKIVEGRIAEVWNLHSTDAYWA
jgi:hypothetical protein